MPPARKLTAATGKSFLGGPVNTKPSRPSKSALSAETINDSDSDTNAQSNLPTNKLKGSKQQKKSKTPVNSQPKATTRSRASKNQEVATSDSSENDVSTSERETSDAETGTESEKSDSDYGSESSEAAIPRTDGVHERTAKATRPNGLKRKDTASSDSGESSSSQSEAEVPSKRRRTSSSTSPPVNGANEKSGNAAVEQTTSTAKTTQDKTQIIEKAATKTKAPETGTSIVAQSNIPPQEYLPPQGYKQMPTNERALLDQPQLQNKVIWHIEVPSGVPITDLTSLTLDAITDGSAIMSHGGSDYMFEEETSHSYAVMLPSRDGYEQQGPAVQRSLKLRAKLDLPKIFEARTGRKPGVQAAAGITSIRPQPKGLRMRYRPPGSKSQGLDVIGDSSDEETPTASKKSQAFQHPKKPAIHTGAAPNGIAEHAAPKSKPKKAAAPLSEDAAEHHKPPTDKDEDRAKRKAEKKKLKKLAKLKAQGIEA